MGTTDFASANNAANLILAALALLFVASGALGWWVAAHPIKVLGRGDITKKLTVKAHKFSGKAAEKIAAAGGTAEQLATGA